MFKIKNGSQGFTLLELLVVVLIIGILAAIALPQYQKAVRKSKFMQFMVLQDAIERAEEVYYLVHGSYTDKLEDLDVELPGGTINYYEDSKVSEWVYGNYTIYLSKAWSQGIFKRLSYVCYHGNTDSRECRAHYRSEINKQVCLMLGGTKTDASYDGYEVYKL